MDSFQVGQGSVEDVPWSEWLADDLAIDDPNFLPNPLTPPGSASSTTLSSASLSPTSFSTWSGSPSSPSSTLSTTSGTTSEALQRSPGLPTVNTALNLLMEGQGHLCDPKRYYSFWRRTLARYFPSDQGFVVQEPFQNKHFSHPLDVTVFEEASSHPTAVIVVAHASKPNPHNHGTGFCHADGEPLVILHLRTPLEYYNDYVREEMKDKAFMYFDKVMQTSHFSNAMVITAMGQAFRAWRKTTVFTEEQENEWRYISERTSGKFTPGTDEIPADIRDTDWCEDVSSKEGQDLLLTMSGLVKDECCLQCWNDCRQI
ncbi:hypothetical protein PQX77_018703 [Marasmius sp. AFHP31]|nr:hypothetical protein PQX77_018703 [Marasmius sp. AFHP31]